MYAPDRCRFRRHRLDSFTNNSNGMGHRCHVTCYSEANGGKGARAAGVSHVQKRSGVSSTAVAEMQRALFIESTDEERANDLGRPVDDNKAARKGRARTNGPPSLETRRADRRKCLQPPTTSSHHGNKRQTSQYTHIARERTRIRARRGDGGAGF